VVDQVDWQDVQFVDQYSASPEVSVHQTSEASITDFVV